VGGIPEVVGGAGPLLTHDPAAWAKAVRDLHADEAAMRRAGQASHAQSRTFDWDRICADLEGTYEAAMRR
jgi:glycosyltransferase involved in cell wall biosynthesis